METPEVTTEAAAGPLKATLIRGETYRVMGLSFVKGVALPVSEKQAEYLKTVKAQVNVAQEDDSVKAEDRPVFSFSDAPVSAEAPRRARARA